MPVFGALLYSFTGALIGLLIGLALDTYFIKKKPSAEDAAKKNAHEIQLQSLMLAMYLFQVTDGLNTLSVETVLLRLEKLFGRNFIQQRKQFIRELTRQRIQVDAICNYLKMHTSPAQRFKTLSDLAHLVVYDTMPAGNFRKAIVVLGSRLDCTSSDIEQIILQSLAFQNPLKKYFDVLGISADSSFRETKKAYAVLVKKYHPDTAAQINKNDPQDLNAKFIRTKEAYTAICKANGWK